MPNSNLSVLPEVAAVNIMPKCLLINLGDVCKWRSLHVCVIQAVTENQDPSWSSAPKHGAAYSSEKTLPPPRHRWSHAALRGWAGEPRAGSGPAVLGLRLCRALSGCQQGGAHQCARSTIWTAERRLPQLMLPHCRTWTHICTAWTIHSTDPWSSGPVTVPQACGWFEPWTGEESLGCDLEQSESLIL